MFQNDPETVIVDFADSRVVDQSALQAIENIAGKIRGGRQARHAAPSQPGLPQAAQESGSL